MKKKKKYQQLNTIKYNKDTKIFIIKKLLNYGDYDKANEIISKDNNDIYLNINGTIYLTLVGGDDAYMIPLRHSCKHIEFYDKTLLYLMEYGFVQESMQSNFFSYPLQYTVKTTGENVALINNYIVIITIENYEENEFEIKILLKEANVIQKIEYDNCEYYISNNVTTLYKGIDRNKILKIKIATDDCLVEDMIVLVNSHSEEINLSEILSNKFMNYNESDIESICDNENQKKF